MPIRSYKDLTVHQRSMAVVLKLYKLLPKLPHEEKYGLKSQLCRVAVSIPLNIAEGYGRGTRKDYAHFIANARGSALELDNALDICVMLNFLNPADVAPIQADLIEVEKMLTSLRSKLLAVTHSPTFDAP